MSDFFDSTLGQDRRPRRPKADGLVDLVYDVGFAIAGAKARTRAQSVQIPRRRILVLGVSVPGRLEEMDRVVDELRRSRHELTVSVAPMAPVGKFENLTRALQNVARPASSFDWIVLTDDDIAMPSGFLDDFIGLAEAGDLALAQPAHRRRSYASYTVTRRRWGSLVRRTHFVEIGPITAIRGDIVQKLIPFPDTRWAWGLDVLWAQLARDHGWRIGVVDAVAVEHLRPVGGAYDTASAIAEARLFLARHGVTIDRQACFRQSQVLKSWWSGINPATAQAAAPLPRKADAASR